MSGSHRTAVVRTRLRPPVPPRHALHRAGLLAVLDAGEQVTLVAAPRGSGKTVLLAQWAAGRDRTAWITFSRHDDSAPAVWRALLEALRPFCGLDGSDPLPAGTRSVVFGEVLPDVVNALHAARGLTLVLDGLDVVDDPLTRQSLYEFVERLPPHVRVVLATARPPGGPVAMVRAAGRLTEITEDDLRLDPPDTAELLSAVAGFPIAPSVVDDVRTRFDGWATGVRLAGVALRGVGGCGPLPASLTEVEEYFSAELLERVTSAQRRLLLHCGVLDEVTPDGAEALTGSPGAGEELRALAASTLFLRRTPRGFRIHPALRPVLHDVLVREEPGMLPVLAERAHRAAVRDDAGPVLVAGEPLSPRELAVLRALAGPLTLREIAAEMHLSHNTVKTHVRSVFRKLRVHERRAAVVAGRERGEPARRGLPGGREPTAGGQLATARASWRRA
ncbi:helix-turn-helix transcriptional regulator [Pseudonocardia dioxanivorans]|uniref:helix-turn-helix transcriptional regulator n=1 Tax=Pseudonocardia dioxanivorans TaxID=240495 RepID=UPI000CD11803|nr:LuxR C-terminal-related transcriptional regulator [Pseudonocardia dioxanivorans]